MFQLLGMWACSGLWTRHVPGSKIGWTGTDRTAFPFKTRPVLRHLFPVNPCFKRSVRPFKTRSRVYVMPFFTPFFPGFQPVLPVKPVQHIMQRINYIIFDREFNRSLSRPVQRRSTSVFFSVKGLIFCCQVSVKSNLSIDYDWMGLNRKNLLERRCHVARLSSFKCNT